MGGQAEGLACADPGARTPIGASGNFYLIISIIMVTNIICFIITGTSLISHWAQMKDLNSR